MERGGVRHWRGERQAVGWNDIALFAIFEWREVKKKRNEEERDKEEEASNRVMKGGNGEGGSERGNSGQVWDEYRLHTLYLRAGHGGLGGVKRESGHLGTEGGDAHCTVP